MFIAKPGLPVLMCALTGADLMKLDQDAAIKFFLSGGFMVTKCPREVLESPEVLAKFKELGLKKGDIQAAKQMADHCVINMLTDMANLLPEWVVEAILLHEVGHVVNGDLGKTVDPSQKVNGIYINAAAEIAADAYAVKRVGKKTFAKALVYVLETMGKFVATKNHKLPFNKEIYGKYMAQCLFDPIIRARFNALQ